MSRRLHYALVVADVGIGHYGTVGDLGDCHVASLLAMTVFVGEGLCLTKYF
jgi:hypothetical protein